LVRWVRWVFLFGVAENKKKRTPQYKRKKKHLVRAKCFFFFIIH
jgi:hypothetical protein